MDVCLLLCNTCLINIYRINDTNKQKMGIYSQKVIVLVMAMFEAL